MARDRERCMAGDRERSVAGDRERCLAGCKADELLNITGENINKVK